LQRPLQQYRALFELSLMVEDHRPRIKECAAAAVQSALSLPRAAAADASQPNFLRQLMDHLKSVGGDHLRVCIQLWMQRSCSDQPSTCTAIKNLGRCYEMNDAPDDLRPAIRKRARAVFFRCNFLHLHSALVAGNVLATVVESCTSAETKIVALEALSLCLEAKVFREYC
jgi:hypothetical protein